MKAPTEAIRLKRNKKIANLYKKEVPVTIIAEKVDLAPNTVVTILRHIGIYCEPRSEEYYRKLRKRNNEIIKLYKQGKSVNSIAKKFKRDHKTIRVVLTNAKVYKKTRFITPELTKDQIRKRNKEICRLYKQGATLVSLAKKYNRDPKTIVYVVKKAGIYKPGVVQLTRKEKEERRLQLLELYKSGMSDLAIARALSMHKASVFMMRKSMGLKK